MSLFRSFLLVFFAFFCAMPCFATPELLEEPTDTLLISNKSRKDLIGIRFIEGETISLSRLDLSSGEEEELENPGGVQELRLDFGLSLCSWQQIPLNETKAITSCPQHEACVVITFKNGKTMHKQGSCTSLLPEAGSKPVCSLGKFRTGMHMSDACGLISTKYVADDTAYIASLEFAGLVWSARLYSGGDTGSDLSTERLEDIELRQTLSRDTLASVRDALSKQKYIAWQAAFPGIDMNFSDMKVFDTKERMELLDKCIDAFLSHGSGEASIMFAPADKIPVLSTPEGAHQDVQIFTVILQRDSGVLVLDMAAYSAEEHGQ